MTTATQTFTSVTVSEVDAQSANFANFQTFLQTTADATDHLGTDYATSDASVDNCSDAVDDVNVSFVHLVFQFGR